MIRPNFKVKGGDLMNKKALMAVTLIAVVLMLVPLVVTTQARKTKASITEIAWNFEILEEETKECNGITIIKRHGTGNVMVISPAVGATPVFGTFEYWSTNRFDSETGYGKYSGYIIDDFTSSGGGKFVKRASGNVAGSNPITGPAWYVAGDGKGVGTGAYSGFRMKTIFSFQLSLPYEMIPGVPTPFGGQVGIVSVGEISY